VDAEFFKARGIAGSQLPTAPLDPDTIDYLVLTHAHLDHTGWLAGARESGYRGPIFANPATIELRPSC